MNVYLVVLIFWSLEKPGLTEKTEVKIMCQSAKLYHQWYQRGDKNRLIGDLPLQEGVHKTVYIINVEKFDDDTEIFCLRDVNDSLTEIKLRAALGINGNCYRRITITNNDQIRTEEPAVLTYSETKNVHFSCEEYVKKSQYTRIGVINMTSNVLNTFNATLTNKNFNIKHNGTVLCCIYYVVTDLQQEKRINRYVAKKTLLFYHDAYQQDNLKGFTGADSKTYILYVTIAVTVAIILIVICITIRVYKKRYTKKSNTDPRVLYVDLDLLRQAEDFHRPDPQEESPYAQIIGEIRPPNKMNG